MKVRAIKGKTDRPYQTLESRTWGIVTYGRDNLYPENLRNALLGSSTGTSCMERYAKFIEGGGFDTGDLGELVVNLKGETLDDIHSLVCGDIAMYGGFALHVAYNVFGEVVDVRHVPFALCRLCTPDDWGYISQIAIHPDWTGRLQRNGRTIAVNRDNIDYVDVFNPDRDTVAAQIERVGGIGNYKGQILWVSLTSGGLYPIGKCDRIFTDLLTDAGLSNVRYRNACCNFLPAGMIVTRRGSEIGGEDEKDRGIFTDALTKMQGDVNTSKILEANIETDEEKPEFVRMETNNYDKAFTVTEESVTERIYSTFGQEAWYSIRIGKLGFSGSVVADAYAVYNSSVDSERRTISRAFKKIFTHWHEGEITDFTVKPLEFIANDTTQQQPATGQ